MSLERNVNQGNTISNGDVVNAKIRLSDTVVMREFVSETVLMNINTGKYYKVDSNSALLIKALLRYGDVNTAANELGNIGIGSERGLQLELLRISKNLRELDLLQ